MGNTILLVDDDPQLSHIVEMYLEMEGFAVLKAHDGIEALEVLTQKRPDVILMDLMMPNLDGAEATRRIRSDKKLSAVPVIVFTAAEERETELKAAGADAFIAKPYSLTGLGKLIREMLESGRPTAAKRR